MGLLALREANSRIMVPDGLLPEYQEFVEGNRIDKTGINKRLMELSGSTRFGRLIYVNQSVNVEIISKYRLRCCVS